MSASKMNVVKKTKLEEKLTSLPKFEPGKSYKWNPDDEFVMDGKEFSLLYNVLKEESVRANAIIQSFNILHGIFEDGIKEGTITEMENVSKPEPKIVTIPE